MNANEALQMIKLFEAGVISSQTFCEKLGLDETLKQEFTTLLKNRIRLSHQTFYEKIETEEEGELLQKEKLEVPKVSRFDLI